MPRKLKTPKSVKINEYMMAKQYAYGEAELHINGDIVDERWFDEDVSPVSVLEALDSFGSVQKLNLFINTFGGSCKAGIALLHVLERYKERTGAKITSDISYAASMGTVIPLASDTIRIYSNAMFMIHNPWGGAMGESEDMRKAADRLDMIKENMVALYMKRFKGSEEDLRDMMDEETWMTPKEVLEWGFADEIIEDEMYAAALTGDRLKIQDVIFSHSGAVDKYKEMFNEIKSESEVDDEMKYDAIFEEKFGITEEEFASMTAEEFVAKITEATAVAEPEPTPEPEPQSLPEGSLILETETVNEALETEEITAEQLLAFAVAGKNAPVEVIEDAQAKALNELNASKAAQFDKIYDAKVKETIEMGVRAYGAESFDEKPLKKTFDTLQDYDHVCAMHNTYEAHAKATLNAGGRASVPTAETKTAERKRFINTKKED